MKLEEKEERKEKEVKLEVRLVYLMYLPYHGAGDIQVGAAFLSSFGDLSEKSGPFALSEGGVGV